MESGFPVPSGPPIAACRVFRDERTGLVGIRLFTDRGATADLLLSDAAFIMLRKNIGEFEKP